MKKRNEIPATDAQRQLAWSRRYLRREKRRRLLRRVIPILILAGVFAVGVYAATGGELPAWPVAGPAVSEPMNRANQADSANPANMANPTDLADPASVPSPASVATQEPGDLPPVQQASFTVTYNSRGGTDVAAETDVPRGALLAAPEAPTREGYAFSGWYADEARTRAWDFAADAVEQDLTLYAGWESVSAPEGGAAMPQTGIESGALFWACVLLGALALSGGVILLLRRTYRDE